MGDFVDGDGYLFVSTQDFTFTNDDGSTTDMATSAYYKFHSFVEALCDKKHNLSSDTLKLYLTNTAPDAATDAVVADLPAEISYTYLADNPTSRQFTATTHGQTGGTFTLDAADITLTASGGAVGPFRYVVIYNDTATNDELIGYYDEGAAVTLNDGDSHTITFNASGIFTLA